MKYIAKMNADPRDIPEKGVAEENPSKLTVASRGHLKAKILRFDGSDVLVLT